MSQDLNLPLFYLSFYILAKLSYPLFCVGRQRQSFWLEVTVKRWVIGGADTPHFLHRDTGGQAVFICDRCLICPLEWCVKWPMLVALCSNKHLKYNFSQIPDWCISEAQPVPLHTFPIIPSKRAEQSASCTSLSRGSSGFDSSAWTLTTAWTKYSHIHVLALL